MLSRFPRCAISSAHANARLREIYSGAELENKLKEMRLSAIKDLIDRQLILQEFKKLQEKGASHSGLCRR